MGAYGALLEKLVPRLEQLLLSRLQQLEAKVAMHEVQTGQAPTSATRRTRQRRPRHLDIELGAPSVVVLGARLRADRRHCLALLERVATILGVSLKRS